LNAEQIGLFAGLILSLMVFSYLLGDNFLYRLAVYILVGLAAGFIAVVTVESVLLPWFNTTLLHGDAPIGTRALGIVPVILGMLLLLKSSPRLGRLGNLAIAFIVGVGAAVAVVGAVSGTLLPLAGATGSSVYANLLNGFIIVIGTISTLFYFRYLARREPGGEIQQSLPVRFVRGVGKAFIVTTLGVVYAGAIVTGLTIFSERVAFILARFTGGS
jgi:hypothetical protein